MTSHVSRSEVFQILSKVKHPEIQTHNLVELGMIPEVIVEGTKVYVMLALPSLNAPIKEELVDAVHQAATGLADGLEVEVDVTEMDEDQRSSFSAYAREAQLISNPLGQVNKVVAVMSGKGGVGKSSVAGLLASELRRREHKVGILDADITGPSIPKMFGSNQMPMAGSQGILPVSSRTGIKLMSINLLLPDKDQPVVWRGPLIGRAIQQFWSEIEWGELDFLIVDLPPGTADASLTVMQSLPLDGIVLVTSPQDLAGMVVRKAANMAKQLGIPLIGLVENMSFIVCPKCDEKILVFGKSQAESSAQMIGTQILGHLPLDTQLSVMCDCGAIEDYRNKELESITDKVIDFISTGEKVSSEAGPIG
jgi:Mrp family chromosome partitioning ATPase